MTERTALSRTFLAAHGWHDATRQTIAGDASNRRYERLTRAPQETAILMDAPPASGESVTPFISIATYLAGLGLSAPGILAADPKNGFLLLEDLGDAVFARLINRHPDMEQPLYEAASDLLTALHAAKPPDMPLGTADQFASMTSLAFEWYAPGTEGAATPFLSTLRQLLEPVLAEPQVMALRDYHAENLIWLPDREGVARVGLLDFQDALMCHRAYDLVSILQDARRDIPEALETQIIDRYVKKNALHRDDFRASYAIIGVQRNLRILGIFARLSLRDGKPGYLDHLPRVWRHLTRNLAQPALHPLRDLLLPLFPPPGSDVLRRLRGNA